MKKNAFYSLICYFLIILFSVLLYFGWQWNSVIAYGNFLYVGILAFLIFTLFFNFWVVTLKIKKLKASIYKNFLYVLFPFLIYFKTNSNWLNFQFNKNNNHFITIVFIGYAIFFASVINNVIVIRSFANGISGLSSNANFYKSVLSLSFTFIAAAATLVSFVVVIFISFISLKKSIEASDSFFKKITSFFAPFVYFPLNEYK